MANHPVTVVGFLTETAQQQQQVQYRLDPSEDIKVRPGDTVTFKSSPAPGFDFVLCVNQVRVFGGERFEVPGGQPRILTVQQDAPGVLFDYIVMCETLTPGDSSILEVPCREALQRKAYRRPT